MDTIILKCGYCGAAIELDTASLESRICKCRYCKKTVLIPQDHGQIKNWYNRAEELRAACEFDRAIDVYERVLTEDNTDPQAHWGMALSKCGIEFVLDGKTGDYLPTCHRTTEQTILAEPEYQAALNCADASQRPVIEAQAAQIAEIQKKILNISRQEPPYDVFISYKEEDEQRNRTKDSVLAQQIYDELIRKGYRVFYARKTLEGKLGSEYEPIIYAALSSAGVMVVVGTRPEHFKATWVRNEWRRFQLMGKDGGKTIIPAYRDMYPDELPPELSALTALDMERIGFMQELTDGIERCVRGVSAAADRLGGAGAMAASADRVSQNGETYCRLGNFELADEAYATLTHDYPEDYRGWWGRIVCRTEDFRKAVLDLAEPNQWLGYAMELADPAKAAELKDRYVEYLRFVSENEGAIQEIRRVNDHIRSIEQKIDGKRASIVLIEQKAGRIQQQAAQDAQRRERDMQNQRKSIDYNNKNAKLKLRDLGSVWDMGDYFHRRKSAEQSKLESNHKIMDLISEGQQAAADLKNSLDVCQREIDAEKEGIAFLEREIETCKAYLAVGREAMEKVSFADLCEAIGVTQPRDTHVMDLREAAFAAGEAAQPAVGDTAAFGTIQCPICGADIAYVREEALRAGSVTCGTCGCRIDVQSGQS